MQKVFEGDLSCDGRCVRLKFYCIFDPVKIEYHAAWFMHLPSHDKYPSKVFWTEILNHPFFDNHLDQKLVKVSHDFISFDVRRFFHFVEGFVRESNVWTPRNPCQWENLLNIFVTTKIICKMSLYILNVNYWELYLSFRYHEMY